jgi:hypothetical protein
MKALMGTLLIVGMMQVSHAQKIQRAQPEESRQKTESVKKQQQDEKATIVPQQQKKDDPTIMVEKKRSPSIKMPKTRSGVKHSEGITQPQKLRKHQPPYIQKKHKPQQHSYHHTVHYYHPIEYHYLVPPMYLYRGVWVRWWVDYPNGFAVYDGYPYYVWNGYLHRYSSSDEGSFDVVDSFTDTVYATFYGESIREAYDRAAEMRDILNYREKADRYFCAERFEYDPDHTYEWDPDDYPDWLWE